MGNIVEALKNLYAAFGGDVEDVEAVTDIADMVNAVAEQVAANEQPIDSTEPTG
jgi:hypothetical protein